MEITQTEGQRFEVALQVFKSRTEPLKYKSIILYFLDDNTVNCNYPSSYLPPNVTEQRAWATISGPYHGTVAVRAVLPLGVTTS